MTAEQPQICLKPVSIPCPPGSCLNIEFLPISQELVDNCARNFNRSIITEDDEELCFLGKVDKDGNVSTLYNDSACPNGDYETLLKNAISAVSSTPSLGCGIVAVYPGSF